MDPTSAAKDENFIIFDDQVNQILNYYKSLTTIKNDDIKNDQDNKVGEDHHQSNIETQNLVCLNDDNKYNE